VGAQSGPAGDRGSGWYSFDLGSWHLVALNSECQYVGGCGPGSPELGWLAADLAGHPVPCTLVYWHEPRFSSGRFAATADLRPIWSVLYDANVDVVLNGHEHHYERFGPQTPDGAYDPQRGIREFVAGTGGHSRHGFVDEKPNSEEQDGATMGVLELTLRAGAYDWKMVRAPSGTAVDAGSQRCH
jgi:hypothetical protein